VRQSVLAASADPLAAVGSSVAVAMCRYRVIFFKSMLGIDGQPDKCLQQSFVIRRARSVERAVEAAKRRYERRCHVADWRLRADGFETEIDLLNRTY
jgi:hypothetical protein